MRDQVLTFLYQWRWRLIMSGLICLTVFAAWKYGGLVVHPLSLLSAAPLSEVVKNYAQAFVWLAGGVFFGYKGFSGYQIVNLSVSVDAIRSADKGSNNDILKVAVTLSKGDRGTVQLHNIKGRIRVKGRTREEADTVLEELSFDAFRLDHGRRPLRRTGRQLRTWDSVNRRNPLLNLAPGESTIVSDYARVPSETPCLIEVVVLGRRRSGIQMGQWRASCVALPNDTGPKPSPGLFGVLQRLLT